MSLQGVTDKINGLTERQKDNYIVVNLAITLDDAKKKLDSVLAGVNSIASGLGKIQVIAEDLSNTAKAKLKIATDLDIQLKESIKELQSTRNVVKGIPQAEAAISDQINDLVGIGKVISGAITDLNTQMKAIPKI